MLAKVSLETNVRFTPLSIFHSIDVPSSLSFNPHVAHTCNYGMLYFLFGSLLYVIFDDTILVAIFLTFCTRFPIYFLPLFLAISISLRLLKFD